MLIDGDLRRPSLAAIFALPGGVGLTNVLLGDVPLEGALQQWRRSCRCSSWPRARSRRTRANCWAPAARGMVQALVSAQMTVIFDSPPLLPVTDAAILARVTQGAIIVTRIGSHATDQLDAAVERCGRSTRGSSASWPTALKRRRSPRTAYYTAQPSGWRGRPPTGTKPSTPTPARPRPPAASPGRGDLHRTSKVPTPGADLTAISHTVPGSH